MTAPQVRDELSRTLRRLAKDAGVKQVDLATRTGFSQSKVSRYLNGRIVPPAEDAKALVRAMGVADTDAGRRVVHLADIVEEGGGASRIVLLREGTERLQRRFAEIEAGSAHIQTFTNILVPGLLQTADYIRTLLRSGGFPPEEVEGAVVGRVRRQELLNDPAHRFTQVVTEGALRWQAHSPAVMAEQLDHIAELARAADAPRIRIGIIPWTAAADFFPMTGFDLYDERAVIFGTDTGATFLTKPNDVAPYVERFARLCDLAAFGEDAALEADRIASEYRALG